MAVQLAAHAHTLGDQLVGRLGVVTGMGSFPMGPSGACHGDDGGR